MTRKAQGGCENELGAEIRSRLRALIDVLQTPEQQRAMHAKALLHIEDDGPVSNDANLDPPWLSPCIDHDMLWGYHWYFMSMFRRQRRLTNRQFLERSTRDLQTIIAATCAILLVGEFETGRPLYGSDCLSQTAWLVATVRNLGESAAEDATYALLERIRWAPPMHSWQVDFGPIMTIASACLSPDRLSLRGIQKSRLLGWTAEDLLQNGTWMSLFEDHSAFTDLLDHVRLDPEA